VAPRSGPAWRTSTGGRLALWLSRARRPCPRPPPRSGTPCSRPSCTSPAPGSAPCPARGCWSCSARRPPGS
jgi:hypothetical protein